MTTTEIVIVEGRKKLHTFRLQTMTVNGTERRSWVLGTPSSKQQSRRHPEPPAVTGPAVGTFQQNARVDGAKPISARVYRLGAGIPAVRPSVLGPILDGLAGAGISEVKAGVLRGLITSRR